MTQSKGQCPAGIPNRAIQRQVIRRPTVVLAGLRHHVEGRSRDVSLLLRHALRGRGQTAWQDLVFLQQLQAAVDSELCLVVLCTRTAYWVWSGHARKHVSTYMHIHTHTHTHSHTHTHTHTLSVTHTHTQSHTVMHKMLGVFRTHTQTCKHTSMHIYLCTHIHTS